MIARALNLLLLLCAPLLAQGPRLKEAQETLRFIRLAETRRNLQLEESKLLRLNEILDGYEATRLELKANEAQLTSALQKDKGSDEHSNRLLDDFAKYRKQQMENDLKLISDVRALLTPSESLTFFAFYERFQQDVQRRIRNFQQERRADRPARERFKSRP